MEITSLSKSWSYKKCAGVTSGCGEFLGLYGLELQGSVVIFLGCINPINTGGCGFGGFLGRGSVGAVEEGSCGPLYEGL